VPVKRYTICFTDGNYHRSGSPSFQIKPPFRIYRSHDLKDWLGDRCKKLGITTEGFVCQLKVLAERSERTCPIIMSAYEPFTGRLRDVPAYRNHAERSSVTAPISHYGRRATVLRKGRYWNRRTHFLIPYLDIIVGMINAAGR
jgi:hypothetical protein